jgi:TonB family protein
MGRRVLLAVVGLIALATFAHAQNVTKPPVLLQAVAPEYPPAALEAGKQADVKVRIHIDDAGVVTQVDVIEPVGDGFDEAAVAAAMQYVFDPAEIDGKPAAIQVETVIHFVIEEVEEPEPEPEPEPTGPAPAYDNEPGHAGDPKKPVTLEGEVVERGTRSKLPGVIVSVVELGLDTVTDDRGRFYFHGVAPGDWEVLAVDDRYERLQRRVTIEKGEAVEIRLWMHPTGGNPYETIVEGERDELEVTKRTIERRQLTTVPGTFGDPIRVIQSLPGLARAPFALGILIIRGSNPDDTGIYVDGHRVPLLFHFLGGPSIFAADFVESIDLYPSGFPARFGRAHGGVVAIESRSSKSDGIHGAADVDLIDASVYTRAPIGKRVSVAVAGRRSYIDQLLPYVLPEPDPGETQVVVPIYYDWQARADIDLRAEGKLSLFAFASSDQLDVLTKDEEEEVDLGLNTSIDFMRLIAAYRRPIGGQLQLTISPAYGRDTVELASGTSTSQSPYLSLEVVQTTFTNRTRVHGPIGKRYFLDAGFDLESRVTEYDALAPNPLGIREDEGVDIPPEVIRQSVEQLGVAMHADLAVELGRVRVVPGLRVDGYLLAGEPRSSVDPRLTARWRASDDWTLKGYLGRFSQPPQPEALDTLVGNPDLELEHAIHAGVGFEWRPDRLWLLDVEGYRIWRDNLVGFTNDATIDDEGNVMMPNFVNEGYGGTYGLEVLIKREVSDRLYGWLSYTYSHSEVMLPFLEGEGLMPTGFDQTHVANLVTSWRAGAGWELGIRWRMATGRPDTPIVDATYDADSGGYADVEGERRSVRMPFFNQLDARVEKTWLFDTWMLGAYIDVQNVLDAENVEAYEYDYRFRETAPVTGVPIFPTIGIRGQW